MVYGSIILILLFDIVVLQKPTLFCFKKNIKWSKIVNMAKMLTINNELKNDFCH